MSNPAFVIHPQGKRHILECYQHKLNYGFDRPSDARRVARLHSNLYVWFIDEIHQWFVERGISYKLGHNSTVGFFVRVPQKHYAMAKLTWGGH